MTHQTESTDIRPLPRPDTQAGTARRVGVEVEFSGITETQAATVIQDLLGGKICDAGAFSVQITDTELGDIEIVLDTALRKYGKATLIEAGLDAARVVVPIEIVTEPLTLDGVARLDDVCDALAKAGAKGTGEGALLGFGVHFNVEVTEPRADYTCATIRAFALTEDWLQALDPIDRARRLLPFVQPWPRAFSDAITEAPAVPSFDQLRALYAEHVGSRNYALDLLPLFKAEDQDKFATFFPDAINTKARPAFHFRLPDCRIDDPSWSLAREWDRWALIEEVADNPDVLEALRKAYVERPGHLVGDRTAWADATASCLCPQSFQSIREKTVRLPRFENNALRVLRDTADFFEIKQPVAAIIVGLEADAA